MNIEVTLSDDTNSHILKNLWPLYQHDASEFEAHLVSNRHGLLGADDSVRTFASHAEGLDRWWSDRASLFPYLILVNGYPAGFNFVAARSRLPDGIEADFVVHEFFVLHAYRGKGVAEWAAVNGFESHRGRWEIVTWPGHTRAVGFWRRVLRNYLSTVCTEREVDHPWGRRVAFTFDNVEVSSHDRRCRGAGAPKSRGERA